jgi:Ca2+-binding RTX toxin-like protein
LLAGDGTDTADYSDRTTSFSFSMSTSGAATSGTETDKCLDAFENLIGTDQPDHFSRGEADNNLILDGRGGNDTFNIGAFLNNQGTTILGGEGSDNVTDIGEGVQVTFFGGPGDDTFEETQDDEALPIYNGGPGVDQIVEDARTFDGTVDMSKMKSVENGTIFVGDLIGTDGPNILNVEGDNAEGSVEGLGGDDLITFDAREVYFNTMTLNGGDGNDTIIGAGSGDYGIKMNGGAGNDHIYGTAFNDTIEGGSGADTIFGRDGSDLLSGNSGNDKIHGGSGNDTLVGGAGRDRLYADGGDDFLLALDHRRDIAYGGDGNDSAYLDNSPTLKDLWDQIESIL